ncbi:MAG: MerR family transcriptional regulator [Sarcina sp.]
MKLTIGQVSKIFGISTDTLRYYDKNGILNPEVSSENGYRFYDLKHLEKLGLIIGMKYLGISLAEIKAIIDSGDIYEYENIMNVQDEMIDRKIEELKGLKKAINESKKMISEIISFENEYDFSKLSLIKEKKSLYGFKLKKILNSESYKVHVKELEEDKNLDVEDETFVYIQDIVMNKEIKEDIEYVYMEETIKSEALIKDFIQGSNADFRKQEINGMVVSVNFYGTEKEMDEYIIPLSKYFKEGKDCKTYLKFNFCLPRKEDEQLYFVNIKLIL